MGSTSPTPMPLLLQGAARTQIVSRQPQKLAKGCKMNIEIGVAIVGGIFLLINTIISAFSAQIVKRLEKSVDNQSDTLSKKIDETTRFAFIHGEKASFDALTRLTIEEKTKVQVTRFNSRKIQNQERYFSSVVSRILGQTFEGEPQSKLELYTRLTSLNSEENKESLIEQVGLFLERGCNNLVLKITADKNDFELVICESSKIAAFCFHDLGEKLVLHSCIVTSDPSLFLKFKELYEKLWNQDAILEIDFSKGRDHVLKKLKTLRKLEPIKANSSLAPLESIMHEANLKLNACQIVQEE